MIAKYPGKCRYCGSPVMIGRDEYDIETKTSYHLECREEEDNAPPSPADYRRAEALGFIHYDPSVPADGFLLRMLIPDRGSATGGIKPQAH